MTLEERYKRHDAFLLEFKALVHKYAGNDYFATDPELLAMLQDSTSIFQPFIWSNDNDARPVF